MTGINAIELNKEYGNRWVNRNIGIQTLIKGKEYIKRL